MIGERLLGRVAAGEPLRVEVPEGATFFGARVDSDEPYTIEFRRPDGLVLAATASAGGRPDDGDFPDSGISLATTFSGSPQVIAVVVSIDCAVYGGTQ